MTTRTEHRRRVFASRPKTYWTVYAFAWVAFAAGHAARNLLVPDPSYLNALRSAAMIVGSAALWGLLAVAAAAYIARNLPHDLRAAPFHIIAAIAYSSFWVLSVMAMNLSIGTIASGEFTFFAPPLYVLNWHYFAGAVIYAAIASFEYAALAWRARAEAERRVELEVAVARFEPHFLFNALHGVRDLIGRDPEAAKTTIDKLAELFRQNLEITAAEDTFVSLGQELAFCTDYLAIQNLRFGDRLRSAFEIDDQCREAPIPPRLIQPLIENAIKHGVERRDGKTDILVSAAQKGDRIQIHVENDMALGRDDASQSSGAGLKYVEARLANCFGSSAELNVSDNSGRFVAEITMPAGDDQ